MHRRLDAHTSAIRSTLNGFIQMDWVTRKPCLDVGSTSRVVYGLTKKGINGALLIDPQALKDCERTK
jgi:hypothetical protein